MESLKAQTAKQLVHLQKLAVRANFRLQIGIRAAQSAPDASCNNSAAAEVERLKRKLERGGRLMRMAVADADRYRAIAELRERRIDQLFEELDDMREKALAK